MAAGQINLRFAGSDKRITRDLDTGIFRSALGLLLTKAGFARYEGVVTAHECVKASGKTQGLRVGTLSSFHAVQLTWQEGSNDKRISFSLSAPTGVNKGNFRDILVGAQEKLAAEARPKESFATVVPPAPAKNVVNLFDQVPPSILAPRGSEFDVIDLGGAGDDMEVPPQEPPKPLEPAPVAPVKPAVTAAPSVAVRPASSNLEAIAELTRIVKAGEALQEQIKEIDRKLGEIQTRRDDLNRQIVEIEDRRLKLARERNALNVSLEAPEFSRARKELASIRQLLDKK